MTQPSQTPVRYPTGVATDPPFQPLAFYGNRNPFFYHEWEDDFDTLHATYTRTMTGNGTIAVAAGDGGQLLFTTNTTTPAGTDLCSIQLPAAGFSFTAGKKSFFLARLQLADATNAAFIAGLIQTTATPFTVTDGLYFTKASGSTAVSLVSANASVLTTLALPSTYATMANNTWLDMGWYVDRNQNVKAFIGYPLVGYQLQSGTGPVNSSGVTVEPFPGPNASFAPGLTVATLNFTVAVESGTASSKTMLADFAMTAKER